MRTRSTASGCRPGELVHLDVKKLGRIECGSAKRVRDGLRQHCNRTCTDLEGKRRNTVGWEYVHIAVDDSRLAYAEVLPDEKALTRRRPPAPGDRVGFANSGGLVFMDESAEEILTL